MEVSLGPIPARAGEPLPAGVIQRMLAAYPRSRGGTPDLICERAWV